MMRARSIQWWCLFEDIPCLQLMQSISLEFLELIETNATYMVQILNKQEKLDDYFYHSGPNPINIYWDPIFDS